MSSVFEKIDLPASLCNFQLIYHSA